jgi:hypothetical protein
VEKEGRKRYRVFARIERNAFGLPRTHNNGYKQQGLCIDIKFNFINELKPGYEKKTKSNPLLLISQVRYSQALNKTKIRTMKYYKVNEFRPLLVFLIFIFNNIIQAQDFEFIDQHEGQTIAFGVYGNYSYFNSGGTINILESGIDNELDLISRFHCSNKYCYDITIDSNKMFVSTTDGVVIYSLTNPIVPELEGIASPVYNLPKSCIVSDTLLIVTCEENVFLYDISSASHPELLSNILYDFNRHNTYALSQNILYGFEQYGYSGPQFLVGQNISDPQNPYYSVSLKISPDYLGAWPDVMATNNDILFVGFNDTLKLYDIANPDTINFVTQFPVSNDINNIVLENDIAYISVKNIGVLVYDLSNILQPELLGTYHQTAEISKFKIDNKYLYCTLDTKGAVVSNKTDLQNIFEIFEFTNTDAVFGVHIKNEFAYFGMKESGLQIIDISNIHNPIDIGNVENLSSIDLIESIPEYIYCAKSTDSIIHIINDSDVENPQKVGELSTEHGWINDYCIEQNRLFILDSSAYITLYDLTIPDSPILTTSIKEKGNFIAVKDSILVQSEIYGGYSAESKLKLFTIGGNNSLTFQDDIVLGEHSIYGIRKIEIDYPFIYACSIQGIVVLKINNNSLSLCDEIIWSELFTFLEDLVFDEDYIYVSGYFSNEYLVNIIHKTDPYNLSIAQTIDNYFNKLALNNNLLFGTRGISGYFIYGNDYTWIEDIASKKNQNNVICCPNPCNKKTTIKFTFQENIKLKLEIFSLSGIKMIETDITNKHQIVIGLENYPPGVYLCKVSSGQQYSTTKLIVKQ